MEKQDYGDFEEIKDENSPQAQTEEFQGPVRVRMPRGKELIGAIIQRYGGNRMEVKATDNKTRNCRIPGKFKRKLWLRPKDFVMIVPWEFDNEKADIIYKYSSAEIIQLKKKGIINSLLNEF